MTRVLVAPSAWAGLRDLVRTHNLPEDVERRVKHSLEPLARFPRLGREIDAGRWAGFRFLIGPWPWLILVYRYDEEIDTAMVVLIVDGRTAAAPGG